MESSELSVSRRGVLGAAMVGAFGLLAGCASQQGTAVSSGAGASTTGTGGDATSPAASPSATPTATPTTASPREIITRATVPVLCYHQVRPHESGDTSYNKQLLIAEPGPFREQLDAMKEAGYTTIGPEQYRQHLVAGTELPAKPVMLTFDDGKDNQAATALPALLERGMTGTWFIMTVVVGNPGWTTKAQIKELADAGITIGSHTWDHHDVRKYTAKDFREQFDEPRKRLQDLSGQPVESFAYPYGAWNPAALPHLRKAGYTTGFQLDEKPLDPTLPIYTLRRSLAVSDWTGEQVVTKLADLSA